MASIIGQETKILFTISRETAMAYIVKSSIEC